MSHNLHGPTLAERDRIFREKERLALEKEFRDEVLQGICVLMRQSNSQTTAILSLIDRIASVEKQLSNG